MLFLLMMIQTELMQNDMRYTFFQDADLNILYQRLCARLQYLQCISNGDTAVLQ